MTVIGMFVSISRHRCSLHIGSVVNSYLTHHLRTHSLIAVPHG